MGEIKIETDVHGAKKIIEVRANGRKRVATVNELPSRTQKQYKDDVDVNNIISKYKKTGILTHKRNAEAGLYLDLLNLPASYQESMDSIRKAESTFLSMPSEIRKHFDNDPQKLITFLANPQNKSEAQKLGLIKPDPQGAPNLEPKPVQP